MHLLIVEDDARLSRTLTRLLTADSHVVDAAATARDGLDLALGDAGFEAIVLDVGLPDGDGLSVCRDIRRSGSTIPILMLTARDTMADRVDGLDADADDYLVKPMDRSGSSGDEAIADAVAETDRMASLLDDLLVLARTDAEAFPMAITAMDLADEAAEAMDGLGTRATVRSVELALDVAPTPMQGDPDRLRQLIVILVGNAIDHGASPGHIWLRARPDEHRVRLTVTDDGPGIAPADRNHVFERFWRGHRGGAEGSGLGLPIAEWIVAAHDGSIAVDERPDGGARFEVSFPT